MQNNQFQKIYDLFQSASVIMVDGRVTNDWSLEEKDEILQKVADDENPIVISIYGAKLDAGGSFYVPLEYYFNFSDLCDAQIESDHFIVKDDSGASISIYVFTNAASILDKSPEEKMVLQHEENGTDFVLTGDRCYITVNNLTVLVSKRDESVTVDVFPMQQEDGDPVESIVFPYPEGEDDSGNPVEFHGAVTENEVITLCTNLTAEKLDEVMRNHGFKFDENESTSRNIRNFADFICSLNDTEDEVM